MDPAWCKIGAKLSRDTGEFQGLRRMVDGYESDARQLYGDYRELETAQARGKTTAQEYEGRKSVLDAYKAALLRIRETLRALTTASAKQRHRLSRTAREGYCFAVVCKNCGELKRRKYRSDALQRQRQHLAEHSRHEVEIVERKAKTVAKAA
jgi:ribosomal protein L32